MAVWAVIERGGLILMTRRSANTSRSGQWCFPGGGVKRGESLIDACVREAQEEVGLDIEVIQPLCEMAGAHYFRCTLRDEAQSIVLQTKECDDFDWVEPKRILDLGPIMDWKQVQVVLRHLGHSVNPAW